MMGVVIGCGDKFGVCDDICFDVGYGVEDFVEWCWNRCGGVEVDFGGVFEGGWVVGWCGDCIVDKLLRVFFM